MWGCRLGVGWCDGSGKPEELPLMLTPRVLVIEVHVQQRLVMVRALKQLG